MDVCKPNLIWINSSCYRLNTVDENFKQEQQQHYDVADDYEDEIGCGLENTPEINDCQYEILETTGNRYKATFHVSSAFFGLIIGKKGMTRKRIESDTRTKILIPSQGKEDQDLQISGDSKQAVALACNRIDMIISDARKKMGFTHFISIPCNHPDIQASFRQFQAAILESFESRGLDESIFQTPSLLHLTIGTLALMDENEREKAKNLLEESLQEISISKPLEIQIEGLEIMNDDPAEVDVVYAKIINSDELQKLADHLVSKFSASALMPKSFDRVKLHVTLLNTIFRRDLEEQQDLQESRRETLDARIIMQNLSDFHFGSMMLEEIHLSQRRAGKRTKENYYFPSAIVKL